MVEYLHWFDRRMGKRRVVLLMDNFSTHELGVSQIGGVAALQNTLIIWLPANTTSRWQPLDHGIINAWKCYTRQHYVKYLVWEVESLPPNEKLPRIDILQAIRWAVEAWNNDLKPSTIFNCFMKSSVKYYEPSYLSPTTAAAIKLVNPLHDFSIVAKLAILIEDQLEPEASILQDSEVNFDSETQEEIERVRKSIQFDLDILQHGNYIQESADLGMFLNPTGEIIDDDPDFLEVFRPINFIYTA